MWKNMKIGRKIFLMMAAIILIILTQTWYSYQGVENLEKSMTSLSDAQMLSREILHKEIDHLNWVDQLEAFAFTPSKKSLSVQKDHKSCGFGKFLFGSARREAEKKYPTLAPLFSEAETHHRNLHETAELIEKARAEGNEEQVHAILNEKAHVYLEDIKKCLTRIISSLENEARNNDQAFRALADDIHRNLLIALGVSMLVALFLGILITQGVAKPIARLSRYTEEVGRGNYDAKSGIDQSDEVGLVTVSVENMVEKMKATLNDADDKAKRAAEAAEKAQIAMSQAEKATEEAKKAKSEGMHNAADQLSGYIEAISAAASELSAQIEQSDRSAVESSGRLSEAATAMNEMNATVQEVARNASSASTVSTETRNNAVDGQKILNEAMDSIYQVQKVSMELKEDMGTLHEHTQSISQIMSVISDIADQTNLLALNAAIEAARAGEAGRGFAVVADEVRKLAEKTMASTSDVSNAISAIQESARQSVDRMEDAMNQVEKATGLASKSGEALTKIVGNVEETADQVRAIAAASEEQSAASDEINRSISTVNEMSSQTTEAMNEAAKAVSELAQQAENLTALVRELQEA
ncbi:MAG: CZB domain-containing protein [Desulfovibrio sp.]|nr:CZB domain-containing protein [Desulfovibrio sp.]